MPAAGAGFSCLGKSIAAPVSAESEFSISARLRFGGFFCSEQGLPLAFGTAAPQVLDREMCFGREVGRSLFRCAGNAAHFERIKGRITWLRSIIGTGRPSRLRAPAWQWTKACARIWCVSTTTWQAACSSRASSHT